MYTEFMGRSPELSAAFEVARALLKIGAVFLKPDDPFIWASGIKPYLLRQQTDTLGARSP